MFERVIGHEDKKKYFENIIKNHNISHCYIFSGNDGIGKLTFAKQIAKNILNTDNLDTCIDYKFITKHEEKKDIVVEQIRKEIINDVYIKPISGEYKVYIIDEAQNLNIAAQNALLKTLEEPPKHIVIILICSNINKILPTILSRVSKLNFNGLRNEQIQNYLKDKLNTTLPLNVLEYVDGSIGKAISIVNNNLNEKYEQIDSLVESFQKKEVINALDLASEIDFNNNDLLEYLEFRMFKNNMYSSIKYVHNSIIRLRNNGNYEIVIDNMILRIIDSV